MNTATMDRDQKFAAFDQAHPEVANEIARLARQAKDRGDRISCKTAVEIMRWMLPDGHPLRGVRINNTLTALLARAVMDRNPDLRGFFETRRLR